MKPAFRSDDDFLHDVERARERRSELHIWWMGQSGFLLQWEDSHVLFDPYLSESLTRKYFGTEKPHVRLTERVVAPERLDFVDVVTSTHNHTDHLDADTLKPLLQVNDAIQLIIPEANRAFVTERLDIDPSVPIGLDAGETVAIPHGRISAVPAAHEDLDRNEHGQFRHLGYVAEIGPWTVYHSGDTVRYADMEERLSGRPIDVALLPINGRDPARGVAGNLDGPEAAILARDIGARLVIPCHFDMFEFNTASPEPFVHACERVGQPYAVLRNGERWSGEM